MKGVGNGLAGPTGQQTRPRVYLPSWPSACPPTGRTNPHSESSVEDLPSGTFVAPGSGNWAKSGTFRRKLSIGNEKKPRFPEVHCWGVAVRSGSQKRSTARARLEVGEALPWERGGE